MLIKLDEKIASEGEVSIVKFTQVDPLSIFSTFQVTNYDSDILSKLYTPLTSYLGNDIYKEFGLSKYCENLDKKSKICKAFLRYNWPEVYQDLDISQQEALEKQIQVANTDNENKNITTNIGGVFGLMAGYKLDIKSVFDAKVSLFLGSEAEVQFKVLLPKGNYSNINFNIGHITASIINKTLDIFGQTYGANITGVFNIGIKDMSLTINNDLNFNIRGGYKVQKEFRIISIGNKNEKSNNIANFKKFKTKDVPADKDFYGDKVECDLSISLTLESALRVNNEVRFGLNGGVEYKNNIIMNNNPKICPSPHFLGRNLHKIYIPLETTVPLTLFDHTIFPPKKFSGDTPVWTSKVSNPWCFGGYYYSINKQQTEDKKAASLFVKTVNYASENNDKTKALFQITVNYYHTSIKDKSQVITLEPFSFPDKISQGSTVSLNKFYYLKDFSSSSVATFECLDLRKNTKYSNKNAYPIGNGYDGVIEFVSPKGTKIEAKIIIEYTKNFEYGVPNSLDSVSKYISVSPDIQFRDSFGLIYHKQGSNYDVAKTNINDEFEYDSIDDCIYTKKNAWNITVESIIINEKNYKSVVISFDKIDGKTTKTIYSKEINKENIEKIEDCEFFVAIQSPDCLIKMNIEIKKSLFEPNVRETDIKIDHNFFLFEEKTLNVQSKNDKWQCNLKFNTYNYPVIFNVDTIHTDSFIVFAPCFKFTVPFSSSIIERSPSTNNVECPLNVDTNNYGILKLEFEVDIESFESLNTDLNALLIIKKLTPLCDANNIGENTYIVPLKKKSIITSIINGKDIAYYPIPFIREADNPDEKEKSLPSITIVDIFLPPSKTQDFCDKIQIFPKSRSFIHNACVLSINELTKSFDYFASTSENNVNINQYFYPNSNSDVEWKLFGFTLDSENKSKEYKTILWQQKEQYPENTYYHFIDTDITHHFANDEEQYILTCPRCKSIHYKKISDPVQEGNIEANENNEYIVKLERERRTQFCAICKDNEQMNCEISLNGLDKNKLTLLSIPLIATIRETSDENSDSDFESELTSNYDMQFITGRESITYSCNTKSKITILHEFDEKLSITITAKAIGQFIRVSSNANGINIPFYKGINDFGILKIENISEFYLIGGNLYFTDSPNFKSLSSIDPSNSNSLFRIDPKFIQSINVDYNNIGEFQDYDDNKFCFIQNDNEICAKNAFPLKYPDYNNFELLCDSNSQHESPVIITVMENISRFYPILDKVKQLIFTCSESVKISGEFTIQPGCNVTFSGPFDLTDLKITSLLDWQNELSGILLVDESIQTTLNVEIYSDPAEYSITYEKDLMVTNSTNIKINLLQDSMFISSYEKFDYKVNSNKIKCQYRSSLFPNKNEFCIYNLSRNLCSSFNDMDSIPVNELNIFQNYFHGSYVDPIILHLVEDMKFNENTLTAFFEKHPSTSILITANNNNKEKISLKGVFICPNRVTLSFNESDDLQTNDLIIEKKHIYYKNVSN